MSETICLTIKKLQGEEVTVEIEKDAKVSVLKTKISEMLSIPEKNQTLLFLGQALLNDKLISEYRLLKNKSKVYLIFKPDAKVAPKPQDDLPTQAKVKPVKKTTQESLKEYYMRKYAFSEERALICVQRTEKYIAETVRMMSLHDIDRWLAINRKRKERRRRIGASP